MTRFPYNPIAPHIKVHLPYVLAVPFTIIYDHAEDDPQAAEFAKLRRYLCGQTGIFPIDALIAIAKSGEYRNGFCLPIETGSVVSSRFSREWEEAMKQWPNEFTRAMKRFKWHRLDLKLLEPASRVLQVLDNYASPTAVVLIASQETLEKAKKAA
jgi:hypothetical protein